jgi:molecular chaperone GrpE
MLNAAQVPDSSPALDVEISSAMQLLLAEMQSLREDFDTKVKYDKSKEHQIDSLHQELQAYREGLHFKILQPIFKDLIVIHDDLGKLIENMMVEGAQSSEDRMIKNLQLFQYAIEEILSRNGVEAFCVGGNTFTPSKQRAIQAIDTSDLALDKQIVRRVRKGFSYDDRVLRPEEVITYRAV